MTMHCIWRVRASGWELRRVGVRWQRLIWRVETILLRRRSGHYNETPRVTGDWRTTDSIWTIRSNWVRVQRYGKARWEENSQMQRVRAGTCWRKVHWTVRWRSTVVKH